MALMDDTTHFWLMHQIRNNLKETREEQGLTVDEVALEIDKDPVFVRNCESGRRRIDPVELMMFARAYGVDVTELLDVDREEAEQRDYKPGP